VSTRTGQLEQARIRAPKIRFTLTS